MKLFEKTVSSDKIYDGRIITLYNDRVELENDNMAEREYVTHPGGVCIIAVTEDKFIYLVNQFRYPYKKTVLEVPAGKRDKNEDPLVCAERELLEETGLTAGKYTYLGEIYPSPGYTNEVIHIYMAEELSQVGQKLDDGEFLDVIKMPFEEAVQKIISGEIKDAKTQIAILKTIYIKAWC